MDAILGHRPSKQPSIVVDSGTEIIDNNDGPKQGLEEESSDVTDDQLSINHDNRESSIETETPSHSGTTTRSETNTSKKGKKCQIDVLQESLKEVVKQVINAQKESERMFFNLEEKRIKLEEAQQEQEARTRREDQEFQLHIIKMLTSYPGVRFLMAATHCLLIIMETLSDIEN